MKAICIILFLVISLLIHEAKSRSNQQYDNSYKQFFSQFKVARELRSKTRSPSLPSKVLASYA